MIQIGDSVHCPDGYGTVRGIVGPFVQVRLVGGRRTSYLMHLVQRARDVTGELALRLAGINPDDLWIRDGSYD